MITEEQMRIYLGHKEEELDCARSWFFKLQRMRTVKDYIHAWGKLRYMEGVVVTLRVVLHED